jgi:hypothetical protein
MLFLFSVKGTSDSGLKSSKNRRTLLYIPMKIGSNWNYTLLLALNIAFKVMIESSTLYYYESIIFFRED